MEKTNLKYFILIVIVIILFTNQFELVAQNKYNVNIVQPDLWEPPSIRFATNSNNNVNNVIWSLPENSMFLSVGIYRETIQFSNKWELINRVNANSFEYLDHNSESNKQAYRYRVSGFDKCGFETPLSFPHRTINLRVLKTGSLSNILTWNNYEGKNIEYYNIYRGPSLNDLKLIASGYETQYNDTSLEIRKSELFYRVAAQLINEDSIITKNGSQKNIVWSNITSVQIITGDSDTTFNNKLKIFPNPSYSLTTVLFPNPLGKTYELSIYDLTGKPLLTRVVNTSQVEIEIGNLKNGIYLLRVIGEKKFEGMLVIRNIY